MHIAPIDIVEFLGIGVSLLGVYFARQKAVKRDDEQEKAIAELQIALSDYLNFKPKKWYKV